MMLNGGGTVPPSWGFHIDDDDNDDDGGDNVHVGVQEKADTEWKFARSKLWISYFEVSHHHHHHHHYQSKIIVIYQHYQFHRHCHH